MPTFDPNRDPAGSYVGGNWVPNPMRGPAGSVPYDSRLDPAGSYVGGNWVPNPMRGLPGATSSTSTRPALPAAPNIPALPDYNQIQTIIDQINESNRNAQQLANYNRIPGGEALEQSSSQMISNLLNPPSTFAEMDVPSAARGVASGTVGSPFAGVTGIQLSENERLRRGGLGQQYLSAALARNPGAPIADTQAMMTMLQQQRFAALEAERDRQFRADQARLQREKEIALEQSRILNEIQASRMGGGGGQRSYTPAYGGTGMGTAPTLPGTPAPAPGPTPRPSPQPTPDSSGTVRGPVPPGFPDNWYDLNRKDQMDYIRGINLNPVFGLPDYMNPYSGDEMPAGVVQPNVRPPNPVPNPWIPNAPPPPRPNGFVGSPQANPWWVA